MRARNLKPGFFKNELLGSAEPLIGTLFQGLWCLADREGRLEDRPLRICAMIFPYRRNITERKVETWLAWLHENAFIVRYAVGAERYIQVLEFSKHQNPHQREVASEIPPPDGRVNRFNHEPINAAQRERIFTRDGHKCLACNETRGLHIDHIVPLAVGGSSEDDNLQTLCGPCNVAKGQKTVDYRNQALKPNQAQPRMSQGSPKAMPSPASSLIPSSSSPKESKTPPNPLTAAEPAAKGNGGANAPGGNGRRPRSVRDASRGAWGRVLEAAQHGHSTVGDPDIDSAVQQMGGFHRIGQSHVAQRALNRDRFREIYETILDKRNRDHHA